VTAAAIDRAFTVPTGGILTVLDTADAAADKLSDAQYLASFAPPAVYYARCACGSVFEVRASEVTDEDREAIADWNLAHDYCGGDL
jgi:hypothetical protein